MKIIVRFTYYLRGIYIYIYTRNDSNAILRASDPKQ